MSEKGSTVRHCNALSSQGTSQWWLAWHWHFFKRTHFGALIENFTLFTLSPLHRRSDDRVLLSGTTEKTVRKNETVANGQVFFYNGPLLAHRHLGPEHNFVCLSVGRSWWSTRRCRDRQRDRQTDRQTGSSVCADHLTMHRFGTGTWHRHRRKRRNREVEGVQTDRQTVQWPT